MTSPISPHHSTIRMARRYGLLLLALAVLAAAWGIYSRSEAHDALARETARNAAIHVGIVLPQAENNLPDLVLPGSLQAWTEIPVYAHTSGYLKRWLVDIGDHVKVGQAIADIAIPEVDQQVRQAEADVRTAEANYDLARVTAQRWQELLRTHTVSLQDVDSKNDDAAAKLASLHAAQANLAHLRALDVYQHITSPVDGWITARNVDIGTLIDNGSANGNARELFHVADIHRMRVYVPVPETEARLVHVGSIILLETRAWPDRVWQARLTDSARAIDPVSHTLLVQLQLDNPDASLLPGGYVEARFPRPSRSAGLLVPSNALIFNASGTQLAIVDAHNRVHLRRVRVARDFGRTLEIRAGLMPTDRVIVSPPDSISDDMSVVPRMVAFPKQEQS